ncbi:MAG: MoxR family ATPase [Saccharospirillaceae bacterium]|nr:MoxR family ATPase [Pseudomonadales bacterium]NRB78859.1 MoxR family ATPase [Saccharospirillaceae bacterium]
MSTNTLNQESVDSNTETKTNLQNIENVGHYKTIESTTQLEYKKIAPEYQEAAKTLKNIQEQISKVFVGQPLVVKHVLAALLSKGHILLEGVPGLGKTLLVKTLSDCISGKFTRIQFTPDLMPSDVTGHAMYNMGTQKFEVRKGPVFTNLLLADEINRAPAKTQSSLLEVMQESHVTIEGRSFKTPTPFMVLATQNPIEQEGTYPLPEAELDRFIMKLDLQYPSLAEENDLVSMQCNQKQSTVTSPGYCITIEHLEQLQNLTHNILADQSIVSYAVDLVRATRSHPGFSRGAGPRASIACIKVAKSIALIEGRNFLTPQDIKDVFLPTVRHRIQLSPEMEIEGSNPDEQLAIIISLVQAPRS